MSRHRWLIAWGLTLIAGIALRVYQIGDQIIADDEWHALRMVSLFGYAEIFTTFGVADHCIPLTLLYEWLSRNGALSEWAMRAPMMVAGVSAIVLIPIAFRPWLNARERWLLGAMIALWPILIYYSRTARPYALLFLLAGAAIPLAYQWWYQKKRKSGVFYGVGVVLAGWMNPLTLALGLSPLLWFSGSAIRSAIVLRQRAPMLRLLRFGLPVAASLALLIGPPLLNDWSSLTGKAGTDQAGLETIIVFWQLFSGSRGWPVAVVVLVLTAVGSFELAKRDRRFLGFLSFCVSLAAVTVWLTEAAWINHALVLARYLLPTLALVLALAALGCYRVLGLIGTPKVPQTMSAGLLVLAHWVEGPVPEAYAGRNQFTGHMRYQFDYVLERNPYNVLETIELNPVFSKVGENFAPGETTVILAPWFHEWHFNLAYRFQHVHRQPMKMAFVQGLCADDRAGEFPPEPGGLDFRHFTHLSAMLREPVAGAVLTLRRSKPYWAPETRWPENWEGCLSKIEDVLGVPWYQDAEFIAYRFDAD
ncbi:MAG: hypothetical protein AAGB27_00555 [Pseudomonadota bacterium]